MPLLTFSEVNGADFTSSNLPIVVINTNNQTISNKNRIVADMGIIYNGEGIRNNINDPINNFSGKISIQIRGASSSGWSKKQYGFETQNIDGSNRNVNLLGLPKENDWILNGPYYDRSFMRNVLVFKIVNEMGWYASRTRFCELVMNYQYKGIYVLLEKIKRDNNRVDIAKLNPDEIYGDDLTGGYIIKIDKGNNEPGFNSKFDPYPGSWQKIRYQYHDPDGEELVSAQIQYIKNFVTDFETVMASNNYADPVEGYAKYINVDAFIDYFIINEVSKNVDGYRLSAYFHKDKDSKGGKLTAGPVWDYNFSFGNVGYYHAEYTNSWVLDDFNNYARNDRWLAPFWWKKLVEEKEMVTKINLRWQELRQNILSTEYLFEYIDSIRDTLNEAQERNFEIWIGPGDPPLSGDGWFPNWDPIKHLKTYNDEIDYLKTWLENRLVWMDSNICKIAVVKPENDQIIATLELNQNYPNPFNPVTNIGFVLKECQNTELSIYDIKGRFIQIIFKGNKQPGSHNITFTAEKLPSGIYFYRLKTDTGYICTKKMILLK